MTYQVLKLMKATKYGLEVFVVLAISRTQVEYRLSLSEQQARQIIVRLAGHNAALQSDVIDVTTEYLLGLEAVINEIVIAKTHMVTIEEDLVGENTVEIGITV